MADIASCLCVYKNNHPLTNRAPYLQDVTTLLSEIGKSTWVTGRSEGWCGVLGSASVRTRSGTSMEVH